MIAWVYRLVVGRCFKHDDEVHAQGTVVRQFTSEVVGHYVTVKCKKCHRIKETRA